MIERIAPDHDTWDFLTGDLKRDRANLQLVMDSVDELYARVDPAERMRHAVDRAVLVTRADRGILLQEVDGEFVPLVVRDDRQRDLPPRPDFSRHAVRTAWETGVPQHEAWDENDEPIDPRLSVIAQGLHHIMATRLEFEGRPLGVLYVDARRLNRDFTAAEYKVFLAMSGLVSAALENSRLEAENAEALAERVRFSREIDLANDVQQGLYPSDFESPPGFDMAGVGRVCKDLSGDFYDVIPRPDGRLAIVMADVSDHGIPAALYMATARGLLRSMMAADMPAEVALGRLNAALARDLKPGHFVTLFLGLLDPEARALTYASAGHPVWIRSRDGGIRELERTGCLLGPVPDERYTVEGPDVLASGDILLLFTDGAHDVKDEDGEQWGEPAFRAAFQRRAAAGGTPTPC